MRKTVIITAVCLGVVAVGVGIYFAWKSANQILTPPSGTANLPTINGPTFSSSSPNGATILKIKILTNGPVFDYWAALPGFKEQGSGQTAAVSTSTDIFYINPNGQIFKAGGNQDEKVSDAIIQDLVDVKSSPDGTYTLIEYGRFPNQQFRIFNSRTTVWQSLPSGVTAAAWSPDSQQLIYLQNNNAGKSDLIVKNLADAKQKTARILTLSQKDFNLDWTTPDNIFLTPKPSAAYSASLWAISIKNKTISPASLDENGLIYNWSASGKTGLKFSTGQGGKQISLSLVGSRGETRANLDFPTLPQKCFVGDLRVYCAIPQNIPATTVLPDDYIKKAVYFKDALYELGLGQNILNSLYFGEQPVIDAIRLSLINNNLLFINRYDNKLYEVILNP